MHLEVKALDTTLLADALDRPIHEGDLILTDAGRIYFVDFTENSFIRQGFLRVREARKSRTHILASEQHAYAQAQFCVIVSPSEVELELRGRRDFFWKAIEPTRERKLAELRKRHEKRRL